MGRIRHVGALLATAMLALPAAAQAQVDQDRLGQLEAQVISLQNQLEMATGYGPAGGCSSAGCGSSACSNCQPSCCTEKCCCTESCCSGFFLTADYMYWRASRSAMPYAGTVVRPVAGNLNGLPINVGASLTSQLAETGYGRNGAYRLNAGYLMSDCWDVGARYTYFNTNGFSSMGDPTVDSNNVLANRLDRNLANLVLDANFDDGEADYAAQNIGLDYETYDAEIGRYLRMGSKRLTLRVAGGFRYAEINQVSQITYLNLVGGNLFSSNTYENVSMHGWGFRVGGEAHYTLGWGASVFARGGFSALYGEYQTSRLDVQATNMATGFRAVSHRFSNIVPVAELTVGGRLERGGAYIAGGYDVVHWFNMVQNIDAINQDDVDGTTNSYRHDRGDLSLDGLFFEVGYLY